MARRKPVAVALLALLVPLVAACRVDATVAVRVDGSGSGSVRTVVRLDRAAMDAVRAGAAKVEDSVRLDDLRRAGWDARWAITGDPPTSATLTLEKPFAAPEDAGAVVEELLGPDGALRDLRVSRRAGPFSTRTAVSATADATRTSSGVAADAELSKRLATVGIDPVALDRRLTGDLAGAARLRVRLELPGGSTRTWVVGPGRSTRVAAGVSVLDARRAAAWAVGGVLVLAALALGVGGEVAARRRRSRH